MRQFDIAIVGAGLAGSLAALALADSGRSVIQQSDGKLVVTGEATVLAPSRG